MEQKSKLGKVACCDRVLGWLAEGLAVFCPRCGKRIYPEMPQKSIGRARNWPMMCGERRRVVQIDDKIIVQMPKHLVVLYVRELQEMLAKNLDIWEAAIRRGKSESRYQSEQLRRGT